MNTRGTVFSESTPDACPWLITAVLVHRQHSGTAFGISANMDGKNKILDIFVITLIWVLSIALVVLVLMKTDLFN
ncbi:MAG: hypothetical protein H7Y42_16040 [Chitinophagaceae bacterium]|nr:hypothetical protein [Chitinophagaceae bacterium]